MGADQGLRAVGELHSLEDCYAYEAGGSVDDACDGTLVADQATGWLEDAGRVAGLAQQHGP